jgi:hypothetical protein
MASTFTEDLYDAQGNFVKTVEWPVATEVAPPAVTVMHPPTFPVDREYARRYDAWVTRQLAAGRPWR